MWSQMSSLNDPQKPSTSGIKSTRTTESKLVNYDVTDSLLNTVKHSKFEELEHLLEWGFSVGVYGSSISSQSTALTNIEKDSDKTVSNPSQNNIVIDDPFLNAIQNANLEDVKRYLEWGYDVNVKDNKGRNGLHLACLLPPLMSGGLRVNITDNQPKLLEIMHLLIINKIDVNARDDFGNTPMSHLFHDRDSYNYLSPGYSERRNLIRLLRLMQVPKLQLLLKKKNVNIFESNHSNDSIVHYGIKCLNQMFTPFTPNERFECLDNAYFNDHVYGMMIDLILKTGFDVNTKNEKGVTPIQIAVSLLSAEILKILLRHGAEVEGIKFSFKDEPIFYFSKQLPTFKATINLFEIIGILIMRDFNFTREDILAILKFLIVNNMNYQYNYYQHVFQNCLEYGTDTNIMNIYNIMKATVDPKLFQKIIKLSYSHFVKVVNARLFVSKGLKNFFENEFLNPYAQGILMTFENLRDYIINIMDERNKLELMKINDISIADILTLYPDTEIFYDSFKDTNYKKVLQSDQFNDTFPLLRDVVKGYFTKCLIRVFVIKETKYYLGRAINLPDQCTEKIFSYLSNEDLLNLCLAAPASKNSREKLFWVNNNGNF